MKSKHPPIERYCRQCQQEFMSKSRCQIYCSKDCVNQYNIENKKSISGVGMYPYEKVGRRSSRDKAALERYHAAQSGSLNPKFGN